MKKLPAMKKGFTMTLASWIRYICAFLCLCGLLGTVQPLSLCAQPSTVYTRNNSNNSNSTTVVSSFGIPIYPANAAIQTKMQPRTVQATPLIWDFPTQKCESPVDDQRSFFLFLTTPLGTQRVSGSITNIRFVGRTASNFTLLIPRSFPVSVASNLSAQVAIRFSAPSFGEFLDTLIVSSVDSNGVRTEDLVVPIFSRRIKRSFKMLRSEYAFPLRQPNQALEATFPLLVNDGQDTLDWDTSIVGKFLDAGGAFTLTRYQNRRSLPGDTVYVTVRANPTSAGQTPTGIIPVVDELCNKFGQTAVTGPVVQNPPNLVVVNAPPSVLPIRFGNFICPANEAPFKDTTLKIYNSGQEVLLVTGVTFSLPDYTVISPENLSETSPLRITFNTTRDLVIRYTPRFSNPPDRFAAVTILSNSVTGSPAGTTTLTVSALKDSVNLVITPTTLNFGSVTRGDLPPAQRVTIRNAGTTAAVINPLIDPVFTVSGIPVSLMPNESVQVQVRPTNTGAAGRFVATWTIRDLCGRETPVNTEVIVTKPLPGIGVINPVSFGRLTCASDTTLNVVLQNTSDDGLNLEISNVQIVGGNASAFSFVEPPILPIIVMSGMPRTLRIRFRPTQLGSNSDILRIVSNADNQPVLDVALQGAKDSIGFVVSRTTINFTNLIQNETASDTITIRTTGTVPINWNSVSAFPSGGRFVARFASVPQQPNVSIATISFLGNPTTISAIGLLIDACGRRVLLQAAATILPPRIVLTNSLNFGTLACQTDSTQRITLRNTGGQDLLVSAITGASPVFTLEAAQNLRIGVGDSLNLTVRFTPATLGTAQVTLTARSNAANAQSGTTATLTGIKNVQDVVFLDPSFVSFGSLPPNTGTTAIVRVRNTGNLPIQWQVPVRLRDSAFTVESVRPNPLLPGQTAQLLVRFAGSECAKTFFDSQPTQVLSNYGFNCDQTATVNAIATTLNAEARISLDSVSAPDTRQAVVLPIRLTGAKYLAEAGVQAFTMNIRYNYSLLEPLDAEKGYIGRSTNASGQVRTIALRVPLPTGFPTTATLPADGILRRVNFRSLLGNDTLTTITIDSIQAVGANGKIICVTLDSANGAYRLTTICRAGGPRLIENARFTTRLAALKPNPASEAATIDIELGEYGATTLTVYSIMGQEVARLVDKTMNAGAYSLDFDAARLPSGVYFTVLQTPTQRITRRMEIVR
jgi:Secretion system C-terminal sorting domain